MMRDIPIDEDSNPLDSSDNNNCRRASVPIQTSTAS